MFSTTMIYRRVLKMSAVGLDLEDRVNLGRWRPIGRGSSHLRIYSAGPVWGFRDTRRGQHLQGRRNRGDPGRHCSWDVTESAKEQMAVESSDGTWTEEVRSRPLGAWGRQCFCVHQSIFKATALEGPLGGHLGISGVIFGQNSGEGCYWHLLSGDQHEHVLRCFSRVQLSRPQGL